MDLNHQQISHRPNSAMMNYHDANIGPQVTSQRQQMQNLRSIPNGNNGAQYAANEGNYMVHPRQQQQNQRSLDVVSSSTQRDHLHFQNVTSSTPAKELSSLVLTTQPDDEFPAPSSSAKGQYHQQQVPQHLVPAKKPSTPDRQQQSYSFIQRGNRSIRSATAGGEAGPSTARAPAEEEQLPSTNLKWEDWERTQLILALCIEMTLEARNQDKRDPKSNLQDQSQNQILGLAQVLKWRISSLRRSQRGDENRRTREASDIQISQKEFDKLYGEWLARKGVQTAADGTANFMSMQSMLESTQALCLNDIKVQLSAILKKLQIEDPADWAAMAELLGQQLNRQLRQASLVTEEWITKAEEIWTMIVGGGGSEAGSKRQSLMTPIGSQNLLLSLLLNEINENNLEQMPVLIRRQTGQLMKHLSHQEGIVIQRFYKQYLLQQGLTSTNDLGELKDNVSGVLKTMSDVFQQMRYQSKGRCFDILDLLLEECIQNESNREILKFSSTDIWQGLYYLMNQGMLRNSEGNPLLIGTWIESEAAIPEMAQRLGQYMYVLNQQQMGEAQIQALGSAKQVMKMYGKILEKLLLAFDRDSTRLLKQVCELLLAQKTMIAQSSNTLVPQSSAVSDFVNNNGGGPENSQSRLSHQTSHSEKGKNNREQERFDDERRELHDFSAQVIKENKLLKEKTTKTKYQRNEPLIGDQVDDEDKTIVQGTPEQQQEVDQVTPSHVLNLPLQIPQVQVIPGSQKPQFSTISIQDQQRQSIQSERSGQNNMQRSVGPSAGASHALQLSFQNTAVYQNHGSVSTAISGAPVTEGYQDEERRASGLPSGANSQVPSHNNSILQSQQMAQPSGQGHLVNQSMMSYKSNYSNLAAPNMSLQPGDQVLLQGPFRTHTNSNFNTHQSHIVNNQSTSQDYRTFGNAPREATSSPHMQRNNPTSNSRIAVNESQMKVKKGSQIDLHQLASRHGHNDSIRQQQQFQQNPPATTRRHHEQNQGYKGPVIQDNRRSKNSSVTSGANAATKKSSFPGVSPVSKATHQQKVGISKTRSRLGSTRMTQVSNNPHGGLGSLSQNCSVNQSISIGGGGLVGATSHASNHGGGADRSPIRMRNVEDYSQVMQRLKQQVPNGNITPKTSRNKVQKATTERANFATSHERQKAGDRRHSHNVGSATHRPATQQQQYQQQMYSQKIANHHSTENLAQRQKIQAGAWIADRSHNTQIKTIPGHVLLQQQQQQQIVTQRWQEQKSPNNMLSSSVKSRGASSNRDGSAASFGRANYRSNESAVQASIAQQAWKMGGVHQKLQVPLIQFQPQRPASQLTTSQRNQFAMFPPQSSSSFEQLQPYPKPEVEEENYVSGGGAKNSPPQGRQRHGTGLQVNDAWSNINRSTINSSKSIGVTGKRQHPQAPTSSQSSTSFSPYPGSGSGMNSAKDWRLFPQESDVHPYHGSGQGYHGERQVNLRPHNAQGSSNKNINPSISRLNNVSTSKSSFLHQQSMQGMQAASQIGFPGSGNYFNIHSNKQLQSSLSSISQTTITNGGGGINHSRDGISQQEMESILAHQRMLSGKQSHPSFRMQSNNGQQIAWPQNSLNLQTQKQQSSMIQRKQPYLF